MHVLVATLPYLGHALPTETVVRALVKRGHTVTWLTGPAAEKIATRSGATFRPLSTVPDASPAPLATWLKRLQEAEQDQANDLATFTCDVVLADPTMLGAQVWAGETSTPLHVLGIVPFLGVSPHATQLWQATIQDYEPWRLWSGEPVTFTGPLPVRTAWHPPAWWTTLDSAKPRVIVTQGTLATDPARLCVPVRDAIDGLDVTAVYTAPASVAPTAAPWLPLPSILDGAALLVTSGGYGGIQAALVAGVPVLVAGDTEDKIENGVRVEYAGIGGYLPAPYTAERLKEAIVTVMQTPRFYERARELQGRLPTRPAAETIAVGITQPRAAQRAA
jgi:UDP:flavonoid glycosyltransferase YjiC (YdhE family)